MTCRMRPLDRGARYLAALLLVVLIAVLGGCSLVRFGYDHVDVYAAWKIDEYFDLESRQKDEFARRFARLHLWHRRAQLPDYAAFLDEMRTRVERGLAPADVHWLVDGVKARYAAIAARGAHDAAALLSTVTPAQLATLERRFERDNRRFVEEHGLGSPEDARRSRVRRALAQVRDWVGHLSDEQEQKISALAAALPPVEQLRHEDRRRRQREFLALMGERKDPQRFGSRVRDWLVGWERGRLPEHDRLFAESWQKRAEFYVAVDRLLTNEQRLTVMNRLRARSDDFRRLAARGSAEGAAQAAAH